MNPSGNGSHQLQEKDPCQRVKAKMFKPPHRLPAFLTALLLSGWSLGQLGAQQESAETLKVEVDTVNLNVLVTDSEGRALAGLKKENFRVFEDKVEQQISNFFPVNAPFSVALLLDTSRSTWGKLAQIQDSAIDFLREIHPDDEVMVISFDDEVYLQTDFTRNKEQAERAVKSTRTGGSTQLYDAVYLGMEEIRRQPHRKVMVLFSDGVDTTSLTRMTESLDAAKEADVTIYTILFDTRLDMFRSPQLPPGTPGTIPGGYPGPVGIPGGSRLPRRSPGTIGRGPMDHDPQRGRAYLEDLAETSGGRKFSAEDDLKNLSSIFAQIAEEMRSLYSVSYVSSNQKKDGKYRKLQVRVDESKSRVRTRKGYYSRKSED